MGTARLAGAGSAPAPPAVGWARFRPLADPLLVAALTIFTIVSMPFIDDTSAAYSEAGPVAYALVGVAAVATGVRGRWPVPAVLVASAAVGTYLVLSYPYGTVFGFVVLTVYTVARRRPPRVAGALTVAALLVLLVHVPVNDAALGGVVAVAPALAWVAIPFTVGTARRTVVAAHRRERLAADQRLVDAERLRLSQDVHDVVGHGLAAIQMQADIALHVRDSEPGRMRATLETISRASQEALDELRSTLGSIRSDGDERTNRIPTPGLARVVELCERVEEAGVQVDIAVEGPPRPLPPTADVAAYRVLQEALTNIVKHSAHRRAEVVVRHDPDAVVLEVTNQDLGPGPAEGIGIGGMRRRVSQLGGSFRAGAGRLPGTFQIHAEIPREEPPR